MLRKARAIEAAEVADGIESDSSTRLSQFWAGQHAAHEPDGIHATRSKIDIPCANRVLIQIGGDDANIVANVPQRGGERYARMDLALGAKHQEFPGTARAPS